jgi:hypothetical protein
MTARQQFVALASELCPTRMHDAACAPRPPLLPAVPACHYGCAPAQTALPPAASGTCITVRAQHGTAHTGQLNALCQAAMCWGVSDLDSIDRECDPSLL